MPSAGDKRTHTGAKLTPTDRVCYRCGRKGHEAKDCKTVLPPRMKRTRDSAGPGGSDTAQVVYEYTLRDYERHRQMQEEMTRLEQTTDEAYMRLAEEAKGCAVIDSAATSSVISPSAARDVEGERKAAGEKGRATVRPSDRHFRFGDRAGKDVAGGHCAAGHLWSP